MRGRPRVLSPASESQLGALLDVGVRQEVAAVAVGCSLRTVQRYAARRRAASEPETLEELLASLPSVEEIVAGAPRPPRAARGRSRGWRTAAAALERQYPERWAVKAAE
jgi:hypothetical protein